MKRGCLPSNNALATCEQDTSNAHDASSLDGKSTVFHNASPAQVSNTGVQLRFDIEQDGKQFNNRDGHQVGKQGSQGSSMPNDEQQSGKQDSTQNDEQDGTQQSDKQNSEQDDEQDVKLDSKQDDEHDDKQDGKPTDHHMEIPSLPVKLYIDKVFESGSPYLAPGVQVEVLHPP